MHVPIRVDIRPTNDVISLNQVLDQRQVVHKSLRRSRRRRLDSAFAYELRLLSSSEIGCEVRIDSAT